MARYLLVCCFSILINFTAAFAPGVHCTSTWRQEGATFQEGELASTVFGNGTVSLVWNSSLRQTWTSMGAAPSPPPRYTSALVYDGRDGVFILFGGQDGGAMLEDTWAYDPATNTWTDKNPPVHPSARCNHAMAFDDRAGVVVLYGGDRGGSWSGETWLYYYGNNTWVSVDPPNSPGIRQGHAMTYDPATGMVVLFGGSNTGGTYPSDTWGFNATTGDWKNLRPANAPSGRYSSAMARDDLSGLLLLFGGVEGYVGVKSDTWTYNSTVNNWTLRNPQASPAGRYMVDMAFDYSLGEVLLFGGFDSAAYRYFGDTWGYSSSTGNWSRKYPDASPTARGDYSMAIGGSAVVLFGGYDPGYYAQSDTWAFDLRGSYNPSGTFTSPPFDTGGPAHYGRLSWEADTPPGASITFKFKGAGSGEDLNNTPASGPDGKYASFYTMNGEKVYDGENGQRWFQCTAYLGTSNPLASPILRGITVTYNLPPVLGIDSPAGGENWSGAQEIAWSALDPDNDSLVFDLYLKGPADEVPLAKDLPGSARSWAWNASGFEPGKYRIRLVARDANAVMPLNAEATSSEFNIENPHWNHPPSVVLLSPANNSVLASERADLSWDGRDADGDPITYTLIWSDRPFIETSPASVTLDAANYSLTGLEDNTTYFWAVTPSDGKAVGPLSEVRRFTVRLPPPNHAPVFTGKPPAEAIVGVSLTYRPGGSDVDGDPLTYYLMSNISGMAVDLNSGLLSWRPTGGQIGNWTVVLQVMDGRGGVAEQSFGLAVRTVPPACAILIPRPGQKVAGMLAISGTAKEGAIPLSYVQVRWDSGDWLDAIGKQSWRYLLDTRLLKDGRHAIEARAFDGELFSDVTAVQFSVENGGHGTAIMPGAGATLMVMAVAVSALVAKGWRRKS